MRLALQKSSVVDFVFVSDALRKILGLQLHDAQKKLLIFHGWHTTK